MKFYTKEWYNACEIKSLAYVLDSTDKQVFIILCDDSINTSDVKTLKPNIDLPFFSNKEKQLRLIAQPVHFPFYCSYDEDAHKPQERSLWADFQNTYNNRLRVISLLPENIQNQIEDKRLLALGYAPKKTKKVKLT